jgi:NAD(P)-dependent dehydrogenase (short-subunit alcohol dehydrogenase family)
MIENGGGKIIINAGSNGINGSPLMAHSGAAKAGIINLTKTLAVEWAPFKIAVNAVAPGPIRTPGSDERLWSNDTSIQELSKQIPLQRFGTPQDVVGPILFLLSPAADYMTGSIVTIDGGDLCRRLPNLLADSV